MEEMLAKLLSSLKPPVVYEYEGGSGRFRYQAPTVRELGQLIDCIDEREQKIERELGADSKEGE